MQVHHPDADTPTGKGPGMRSARILVVEDEESLQRVMQVQLGREHYAVDTAATAEEALGKLETADFQLILTDLRLGGMTGLDLLREARKRYPEIPVILVTAFGTIENAVEAMQAGAYHYVTKPVHFAELSLIIARALEHTRLVEEVKRLRETLNGQYGFNNIIGRSEALLSVLDMASRAAQSNSTVLIGGETGTGKELLARAIHQNSSRKARPFLAINCGAIPKDLLESELFGYRRGAFTGAVENKKGKIEAAEGGTLFLDEIGEMPLTVQVKLLRLVQEGEMEKLGALGPVKADVRIIAATNRDLRGMMAAGTFREDLYYRLAVIPMTLPALRERTSDIPDLVNHFFERNKCKLGRLDLQMPPGLLPYFMRYNWPGNIRELENVLERIVVLNRGPEVTLQDLPEFLRKESTVVGSLKLELPAEGISLDALEKELIMRALDRFEGNQTKAAQYLDLSRKTLIYRMEKHGIARD
jgi:DNA-binding NtrC family response regulator